jgi:hypothetical protein
MSKWELLDMEGRIREILHNPEYDTDHHFGRPFLTPYQIGIELVNRYPNILADLELPFGGSGTGTQNSLCQYIANELSRRIQDGRINDIEGRFLANDFVRTFSFVKNDGSEVISSNSGKEYLSMFRIPI